jgi:hypothetical protein
MQRFDHGAAVLAAFFILLGGVPEARAQKVEITPFVGYQFGGEVAVRNGNLRISDDVNYGLILDVTVNRTGQVEASYTRQDTRLVFDEFRVGSVRSMTSPCSTGRSVACTGSTRRPPCDRSSA